MSSESSLLSSNYDFLSPASGLLRCQGKEDTKMKPATIAFETESHGNGARLVAADGRTLPLRGAHLYADAKGGIARVVLEQTFANPYDEPLVVTYSLPLPADAAVSGFAFELGGRRVQGEIDRRAAARERFEQAILAGRSAAIVEQDRSSLFTQEIGNIPPRSEVRAEIALDQKLVWMDEGAWEWRFPTVVMPRYLGEPGRVPDADKVTQDVLDGKVAARVQLELAIRDALAEGRRPESPSHGIAVRAQDGALVATLRAEDGAALDRDLVVRWPVAARKVGLSISAARPKSGTPHAEATYGLLTMVPPLAETRPRALPRDLILLLDVSGSMDGEPLEQSRKVAQAVVETLGDDDSLEMIAFANTPTRWKRKAVNATAKVRKEALEWLAALEAAGGTEMRAGILEALTPLHSQSQRQVVLMTDGAIGFEREIVAAIAGKLPRGSRVHTIGVGSAVNRSLTSPAARAGHGVEIVIGLGEDPERAARRLCARTAAPLCCELELSGSALVEAAPKKLPDLYGGAPALLSVKLRKEGGELRVRGLCADGVWEDRLQIPAVSEGAGNPAVVTLFGREVVEDLETELAAGFRVGEIDPAIERIGHEFQI
jgi:Ca-activated chloride channel family protein